MNKYFADILKKNIRPTDTVLDIGCGNKEFHVFTCAKIITIDGWEKVQPDILVDLSKNDIPVESADVVLMLDFIEHIEKERGKDLLEQAKRIAKRELYVLTPLYWDDNATNTDNEGYWCFGNPFNYHKSLWTVEDFAGFKRLPIKRLEDYFVGVWR